MGIRRKERREADRNKVVVSQGSSDPMNSTSRNGVYFLQATIIVATFLAGCAAFAAWGGRIDLFAVVFGVFAALVVGSSVHVAQQWERMIILRAGKFKAVKGPGLFFTLPFVEYCSLRVDMRIRTTAFGAEETLSTDLVPLDVDAVVFWMVHDASKACMTVDDYANQLLLSAQTILRDAIGRATAAEVTARRDQLDRELKRLLEEKVSAWGITVLSVEVRDILMPEALQEVMSLEAQAEQRKKARLILMEAESDISAMIERLSSVYGEQAPLELRRMFLLYEGMKEGSGTLMVPNSWSDGFAVGGGSGHPAS